MTAETSGRPVADADAMRELGRELSHELGAGTVVVLVGPLGAGKTTFTQGLATGLQVSGPVTSPTFVIAREHRSTVGGPDLVHVDAYRLGSLAELDDLDLVTSLAESVTVVEWGEPYVEHLAGESAGVVVVRIDRSTDDAEADHRIVTIERRPRPPRADA